MTEMNPDDLTKEQIKEMSDEEVLMWHRVMEQRNQITQIRSAMLKFVDIRDAQEGPRILPLHVESEVIDDS